MQKIIILGGTFFQIPVIEYAKSMGLFVITCDYIESNPGHKISDTYYNISTTDKDGILNLAINEKVIAVLAFASDPAAATAAYVNEKLGVYGTTYQSSLILSDKGLWRDFLVNNNFNSPNYLTFTNAAGLINSNSINYPIMIKPTDSSGSKGVTKVNEKYELIPAINYAFEHSRNAKLIAEEYVRKVGFQIGGDAYIGNNKIEFVCFGEQQVDSSVNEHVPCGMIFPAKISLEIEKKIIKEINRLARLLDLKNIIINIEVMVDVEDNVYLMEIGPRSGGNFIHKAISELTGIDLAEVAVNSLIDQASYRIPKQESDLAASVTCYYAIHAHKPGELYDVNFVKPELLKEKIIFKNKGEFIEMFNGSNATIGILIYSSDTRHDIDEIFKYPCEVVVND
ncbi:ATP-grasp domain-containing protein [Vibrio metschnikovii]|uniref:ATP-grasp domain-containing protein n=1 Tax=Vibrio metschnikovii TaxID=28172 RepID=UPI001C2FAC8E|nr:ATP-grasp domain-containing protein [Vibrio metschnikovii]